MRRVRRRTALTTAATAAAGPGAESDDHRCGHPLSLSYRCLGDAAQSPALRGERGHHRLDRPAGVDGPARSEEQGARVLGRHIRFAVLALLGAKRVRHDRDCPNSIAVRAPTWTRPSGCKAQAAVQSRGFERRGLAGVPAVRPGIVPRLAQLQACASAERLWLVTITGGLAHEILAQALTDFSPLRLNVEITIHRPRRSHTALRGQVRRAPVRCRPSTSLTRVRRSQPSSRAAAGGCSDELRSRMRS